MSSVESAEDVLYETLINYLNSMARLVEGSVGKALDAVVNPCHPRTEGLPGEIFLAEPRVNEMEMVIDEQAVRLLRRGDLDEDEVRLTAAALKITNDLERIGDLAVNLAERAITLREAPCWNAPQDLGSMASTVRAMVSESLGALIYRNAERAMKVLESEDIVDGYRDRIFEQTLARMTGDTVVVAPGMQFVLVTRYLERIADHATNIAEDIIFWVRGLEARHGRRALLAEAQEPPLVIENSCPCDSGVTPLG